jgi:hypothetical protein
MAVSDRGRLVIDAWAGSVNVERGRGLGRGGAAVLGVLPAPALAIER